MVSLPLSVILFFHANAIAGHFLNVTGTAPLLRILACIFPICGITSVINGYFYGINFARVPAISQITEQLFRVGFVIACYYLFMSQTMNTRIAVLGLFCGELASNLYNLFRLSKTISLFSIFHSKMKIKNVLHISIPLSANKFVLALLGSIESILIPPMLIRAGFPSSYALGIYGILTGVVMPFILFPGTLTNSLSVLLLPAISHAAGCSKLYQIRRTTILSCHYSLLLGVLTSTLFLNMGQPIGYLLFHSENAGKLLIISSFLCPFLYVSTTLTSVINGLGRTGTTFFHNLFGIGIRILFVLFVTPHFGIYGYLFGMLLSQIVTCLSNAVFLIRNLDVHFSLAKYFLWPFIFCSCVFYIAKNLGESLVNTTFQSFCIFAFVPVALVMILLYCLYFRLIRWRDFY